MVILKKLGVTVLFLATCLLLFASGSGNSFQATNSPSVYFVPKDLTGIKVGDVFDVYVNVVNVEALYGFDLAFVWNTQYVEYVSHKVMAPVEDWDNGVLHNPVLLVKDGLNLTLGTYRLVCASMAPADAFYGNGTLVVITFKLLCTVEQQRPYDIVRVELSNNKGEALLSFENSVSGFVVSDDIWEFIRKRAKDPMVDGWLRWWRTQMRRRWGV